MFKNLPIVLLIPITLLFGAPTHAGIFKWVDANGVTHYSDKAPKKQQSQMFNLASGTTSSQTPVSYDIELTGTKSPKTEMMPKVASEMVNHAMPTAMPDLDAVEYDLSKAPQKVKQTVVSSIKSKLCTDARMRQAALQEAGHGRYLDEDGSFRLAWGGDSTYQGERRHMTDEQAAKLSDTVNLEVEHYCANPYDKKLQDDARANWIRSEYCTVSKAYLAELKHPSKRTSDDEINQSMEEVERYCAELKPDKHRNDDRYYPKALRNNHIRSTQKYSISWH